MRIGYLDCFSGVAGDMWVGALLDLGLPLAALEDAVASLDLAVTVRADRVTRAGLAGTRFQVLPQGGGGQPGGRHRHLPEILEILARAHLPDRARQRVNAVFEALGEVESRVHDQPLDHVHFHEVGAEDTIVDITCACLGVELLGLERLYASVVTTGTGTVVCDHGTMPVPAPGALGNLLGMPIRSGGLAGERVTPTGAALLRVLVEEFEPTFTWTPDAVGYGAGTRDDPGHPNLLRMTAGSRRDPGAPGLLWELSCNLDTATGEELGHLLEALLTGGATDAFAQPLHMKKGRPGFQITALVSTAAREAVTRLLLEESSSLGVRMHAVERQVLERWQEEHDTDLGRVRCKVARLPSGRVVRRAEADEISRLVREHGLPRSEIVARLLRQL